MASKSSSRRGRRSQKANKATTSRKPVRPGNPFPERLRAAARFVSDEALEQFVLPGDPKAIGRHRILGRDLDARPVDVATLPAYLGISAGSCTFPRSSPLRNISVKSATSPYTGWLGSCGFIRGGATVSPLA